MCEESDTCLIGFLSEEPLVKAKKASLEEINVETVLGDSLEVWLTGTGTPADFHRFGPSNVLRAGKDVIVVDCGNGIIHQLTQLGIAPKEVSYIFITHHHIDHSTDLGYLFTIPWVQGGKQKHRAPIVIGPPGTLEYVNRVLAAYDYDIRARVPHDYNIHDLAPQVVEIEDGYVIQGLTWQAKAIRVDHFPVDQAFGFRFEIKDLSVVISGDTKPCDNLIQQAMDADILIHEVIYPGFGFPDYHTLSTEVGKVATKARAKKLFLTHLLPGHIKDEDWLEHIRQDYSGPIIVGKDLLKVL